MKKQETQSNHTGLRDGDLEITTSEIRTFMSCQRKWKHSYLDLRVTTTKDAAPTVGSAVHEGLDCFWEGKPLKAAIKAADDYLRKSEIHNLEVLTAKARAMLVGYYKKYKDIRCQWEVIWIEKNITPTEIIPGVFLRGKVDKLLRNHATKTLRLKDHKSTSLDFMSPDSDYAKALNFNLQATIYKYCVEKELGERVDLEFDLIFREGTKGPKLKKTVRIKKGEDEKDFLVRKESHRETMAEYGDRIAELYLDHPEYYKMIPIYLTDDFMKGKILEIKSTVRSMLAAIKEGVYPGNDASCKMYNKNCVYLEVCCQLTDIQGEYFVDKLTKHVELDDVDEQESESVVPF